MAEERHILLRNKGVREKESGGQKEGAPTVSAEGGFGVRPGQVKTTIALKVTPWSYQSLTKGGKRSIREWGEGPDALTTLASRGTNKNFGHRDRGKSQFIVRKKRRAYQQEG